MSRQPFLIGALALAFSVVPAEAACPSGVVEAWPPEQVPLPINGRILIRATGTSRSFLAGLPLSGPRLVSKSGPTALRLVSRNEGERSMVQVVLEPTAPLRPGTHYALELPGSDLRAGWTTSAAPDQFPPRLTGTPAVVSSDRGAGESAHVTVRVPADDEHGVLLLQIELVRKGSAMAPRRFLVELRDGLAAIGRGQCSGPFELLPGTRYEAALTVMDLAGNEVRATAPLELVGPPLPSPPPTCSQ